GGSLNVVKLGTGTVRLMDPSTYNGSTTIYNGILHFESPASVGGSGQSVVLNSNVASNTFGVAGLGAGFDHSNIKGTFLNRLDYGSEGVVALSSDSNENFDFTDAGLNLPPSIYLGSLGEVIYTGTITNWTGEYRLGGGGGTLYVGDPANPVPNRLTGGNILVIGGAPGTVVLTGPNDYAGGTMIQRGATLAFSAPDQLGSGLITFDNGTLRLTGPNTVAHTRITGVNAGITIDVPHPAGSLMFTGGFFSTSGGQFHKLGEGAFAMSTNTFDLIDKPFLLRGGTTSIIDGAIVNTVGWTSISVGLVDPNEKATLIVDNAQLIAGGDFNVGDVANSQGTLILRNNASVTARTVYVGKNTTTQGAVLQTGGQFVNGAGFGDWRIGGSFGVGDAQSVGAYTMTGGTFSTAANLQVGAWGRGVMTVAGGTATASNWPAVGRFAGSYGVLNILDTGVFNQTGTGNRMIVGENGAGIVNVADGGALNTVRDVVLALGDGGSGVVNLLPGGTINTIGVRRGVGANRQATFNFHGGTLRATTTGENLMGGLDAAYVWSGGAVIDTNGHDLTVSQALTAPTGDGLTGVSLASGGAGYVAHPVVEISGGGGTGASATPVIDGSGAITGIRITNPGVGYTSAPTVAIKGGGAAQAAVVDAVTTGSNASTGGLTKIGTGTL
ncbi:MAG TPA: autotransporter-associated beta strand repeat-containing protein, partial [Candidatus Omnitrophota bacterium]|nr:autotransporter-associated beta strand repeat-containing protein [Candidatus Omnitrophota bacterium]